MYNKDDLNNALEALRAGNIILYPTDTVWGLGCDATNEIAVAAIYRIKQRTDDKSMLVLLDNENLLKRYIKEVPEVSWELIDVAIKPLTIIYPGAKNLATNLVSEDGSVGIRIVEDSFCEELIRRFKKPVVSTSANISGSSPPSTFAEISSDIKDAVDYIVEWRQDEIEKKSPSSIIRLGTRGEVEILRV